MISILDDDDDDGDGDGDGDGDLRTTCVEK